MFEKYQVKLIAAFLGIKFIPLPFVFGINNLNPKLILSESEIEYRSFLLTRRLPYDEVQKVDIYLAHRTTNIHIIKRNSVFTFVGNTNDKRELFECLEYLKRKKCLLTSKAEEFYLSFRNNHKIDG
jgi:hypothetical protein